MRSAERREEIVQGHFIGQVRYPDGRGDPPFSFPVKKVVGTDREVEEIARFHAVGVVIVVLRARKWSVPSLREREQLRGD